MTLNNTQIKNAIKNKNYYARGLRYYNDSANIDIFDIEEGSDISVKIKSNVQGSFMYEQDISIVQFNDRVIIIGVCSCPIKHNCKHVVASCLLYANSSKNAMVVYDENSFDSWINEFENDNVKNVSSNSMMIYRLYNKDSHAYSDVKCYRVSFLQNGEISHGKKVSMDRLLHHNSYSDILNEEDLEILDMLKVAYSNPLYVYARYANEIKLEGKLGANILMAILETNRAFYKNNQSPLTYSQELQNIKLSWKSTTVNKYQIQMDIDKTSHIVLTKPLFIINPKKKEVHKINSNINEDMLRKLTNTPEIETYQMSKMYQALLGKLDAIDISPPLGFEVSSIKQKPIPSLMLSNKMNRNIIQLDFVYKNVLSNYYPQNDKTIIFEDNQQIEIIRDLEFENKAKNKLEDLGFSSAKEATYLYFHLGNISNKQKQLDFWHKFLEDGLDKLKLDGFDVIFDDSFNLTFEDDALVVVESEDSNDWFSLSFNIDFAGQSVSLAPLISNLLQEYDDFDELEEYVNVEVKPNHFARIKSSSLRPILNIIFELYDDKNDSGEIRVSSFESHLLGNIDDSIVWKGSKEILELSKKLNDFEKIEKIEPPKNLQLTLRDYQKEGINWLNFLYEFRFSGILADDMGLGKTVQVLAHLLRLKEQKLLKKPSLIVVPTSLVANWKNEIAKFTPKLKVLSLYGGLERFKEFDKINKNDLIITSYSLVVRDIDRFNEHKFSYIILDEAQKIKNPQTKMSQSIKTIKSEHKLALSGTPIENHLGELWSIFSFLMPGFLKSLKGFKELYQNPIEKEGNIKKQEMLNAKIKPFMIRRKKEDVLLELPAKSEIIKYTQFDKKQAKLYESIRITMEKKVRDIVKTKGLAKSHITILDALLKLRQVCCDPKLVKISEAKKVNESAKLALFLDLIDELLQEDKKILVFSQFTSMLSIIEKELINKNISYTKLTGSTRKREEVINKFTNGDVQIFLISLKAGGVGLNLTQADTVIHYDPWWNPAVENQATDRAHRIGQNKAVFVYKLIVENSIEEKILELQKKKLSLQEGIYKGDSSEKITGKELMKLLF